MTQKGVLRLGLSLSGTYTTTGHEEHCPDINGPGCADNPAPAQWHDLKLFFGELRLAANYGLTEWLSVDLFWSLRMVDTQFQLQDLSRQPIDPPYGEEIHHRNETIFGLTDPWLSLRGQHRLGPFSFGYRIGATIPVGATEENPFRLGREGMRHQHIQFGTGTVDPIGELDVRCDLGRVSASAWALGRTSLYENRHGYRAGSFVLGGLRLGSDLWAPRWRFTLGALAYHEAAERWLGVVENEGNLGRTDLIVETSISWQFAGAWSVTASVRIPVWSRIVGSQLSPAIGELGISRPFDLLR